jgi:hypothetical protein
LIDWLFSYAFWDLCWLEVIILTPCAIWLVIRTALDFMYGNRRIEGRENKYPNFTDYF